MKFKTIGSNGRELYVPDQYELQRPGQQQSANQFAALGTSGLESYAGFITQAYTSELYWPGVEPRYSRIWRSDPEVTIARTLFSAWAGDVTIEATVPEKKGPDGEPLEPTDDDREATFYYNTVLDDLTNGIEDWFAECMARVPFFGWGWWEVVLGRRRQGWKPPDGDPWESKYDDDLVGIRSIEFRNYSSFFEWDVDDETTRLEGMVQLDPPNQSVTIPLERSAHIRYGDLTNPEGLATLEAIWRLERLKYGLEVVQGIGYEHAAGHAAIQVRKIDEGDKGRIRNAARALMSAQEGNYITEIIDNEGNPHFAAKVIDVPFQAAPALLDAVRYYGVLKLALLGMQWVGLSSMTDFGSRAAMGDASLMAILLFNSMGRAFVSQLDKQVGRRLFRHPVIRQAFPNMTRRPELVMTPIEKPVPLAELATFAQSISTVLPLGDDDYVAIRRRSDVLPEKLPERDEAPTDDEAQTDEGDAVDTNVDGDDEAATGRENGNRPDEEIEVEAEMAIVGIGDDGEFTFQAPSRFTIDADGLDGIPEAMLEKTDAGYRLKVPGTVDLARRKILIPDDEEPTLTEAFAQVTDDDIESAMRRFRRWAKTNAPDVARILDAEVDEGESE